MKGIIIIPDEEQYNIIREYDTIQGERDAMEGRRVGER